MTTGSGEGPGDAWERRGEEEEEEERRGEEKKRRGEEEEKRRRGQRGRGTGGQGEATTQESNRAADDFDRPLLSAGAESPGPCQQQPTKTRKIQQ